MEERARRLSQFLSGKRLLAGMIFLQTAVLVVLAALAPPDSRKAIWTAAAFCAAVGPVIALLPAATRWRTRPRSGRLGGLFFRRDVCWLLLGLAGGVLYAAYKAPWPDERAIEKVAAFFADRGIADFFRNYSGFRWAGSQHPPLAGIVYGLTFRLAGHELFFLRLVSLAMALLTLHLTCRIAEQMFDRRIGPAAAAMLLAMPATLRVGATALVGMTVAGTGVAVLLMVWRLTAGDGPRTRQALQAGMAAGIGLWTHYTAALVFPVVAGWYAVQPDLRRRERELILLLVTAAAMLAVWLWVAAHFSIFEGQADRLAGHAGAVARTAYGKRLLARMLLFSMPAALGIYLLPPIVKGAAVLAAERPRALRPLSIWILFPLLIVAATLPDFRYTLLSFPALAIIAAVGWAEEEPSCRARVLRLSFVYCAVTLVLLNEVSPTVIAPR